MAMKQAEPWADLEELVLWDRNYRKGDVDAVARSISRFGFNGSLRIRGKVVYAGNHSLKALQSLRKLGRPAPTGIKVVSGRWFVPIVSIDHLSETEAAAFAIADNRSHDLGKDDPAALEALLRELAAADASLATDAGFSAEYLASIAEGANEEPDENRISDHSGVAQASQYLKWGRHEVFLSSEEAEALSARLRSHIEKFGTDFGFVRESLAL